MKQAAAWLLGIIVFATAWQHRPEIRQTVDRWTCSYKLGDDCVTQEDYIRAIAREQFALSMADLELFCSYMQNRSSPRCSFFFLRY